MENVLIKTVFTFIVSLCAILFNSSESFAQCSVKLPKDFIECNNSAVSIASNTDYSPTYSTNTPTDKYLWTISGGPYTWFGGTTPTERFPKINLQDGYIYTIVIQFTNNFGTCSDTQLVYRNVGLTAEINKPLQSDTLVCFGTQSIDLSAYILGPYTSFSWSSLGSGSFLRSNTLTPTYNLSSTDINNGFFKIVFNALANTNGSCHPNDADTLTVNIKKFAGKDSSIVLCSNAKLNFQPVVTGANQYSWTSQVISGTASGNTSSGSGAITDSLINTSGSTDAVVRYTITPLFEQCSGAPVLYTVTLKPRPVVTPTYTSAICTGNLSNIQLNTSFAGTLYTWTSTVTVGSISGNSNSAIPVAVTSINDLLVNNSPLTPSSVRYIITPQTPFGCTSQPIEVVITVSPLVTQSNAGADRMICLKDTIQLNGNIAFSGPATWSQLSGPNTALINQPANPLTSVTNLVPGIYNFVWTVSNTVCPASKDTVIIIINSPVVAGMMPKAANGCTGSNSGSFTLTNWNGTINRWEYSTNNGQSWSIINNTTNVQTYNNLTDTTWFRAIVESGACGFVFTDTAVVTIYELVTPANAGLDRTICLQDTIKLAGNVATIGAGIWTQLSGPATVIFNQPSNPLTSVSNFQPGTYRFIWTISNGFCPSTRDTVTINISTPTSPGKLSGNTTVCTNSNSGTLILNNYIGNIINWEFSNNGGQSWSPLSNTNNTYSYSNLTTTTWYRTTVQSGACISGFSDTAVVTVFPLVTPANAGADRIICLQDSINLNANAPASGTGTWSQLSGPNTALINNTANSSTSVTNLQPGIYNFIWTISNGVCPASRDTVTIQISTPTVAGAITGDATVCTSNNAGTLVLNNYVGTIVNWEFSINNGQSWINITNTTNQHTYNNLTVTTWYRANVKSGVCVSAFSDTAIITVFPLVTPANAGLDRAVCMPDSIHLNGNAPANGTGTWSQLSGPNASLINELTNPNSAVTNLQAGIYKFIWTVSNGVCAASRDTVSITVSSPVIAGMLPRTADGCTGNNSGSFTLTNYFGNIVRWESSINSGQTWNNIINITNVQAYNNLTATTWYRAIVESGACGIVITDTAVVTIYSLVTPANAGANMAICLQDTINLNGNTPTSGTGLWSQLSGPNTVSINQPSNPATPVTNLQPGSYNFIWTISNGFCQSSRDTVTITITAPVVNRIDTTTQTVCRGRLVRLYDIEIGGGTGSYQYQWEFSYDQNNWTILPGANSADYSFTADTTIYLRRTVLSAPCTSISDVVKVIVQNSIAQNSIEASQTICIGDNTNLITGSIPAGGNNNYFYTWQQSNNGGATWTIINSAFTKDYAPGVISQTTYFRRIVTSGSCNGSLSSISNVVIITVNPQAKAAFSVTKSIECAPFNIDSNIVKVERHDDVNKDYLWYADNVLIGVGPAFPGFVINRPQDSVTIKLKTTSLFNCKDDSLSYILKVFALPLPKFSVSDTIGCGPLTINFTNQTPLPSQYSFLWDFGNGQTSGSQQPSSITFLPSVKNTDTVYTIKLTAFNNCDTVSFSKTITVRSKPKPIFTASPVSGCSPLMVNFNVTLNSTNSTSRFSFGDGKDTILTSSAAFTHLYNTPANLTYIYYPKLITFNECGSDSLSVPVEVLRIDADLKFDIIDSAGCVPHNVTLINRSTGTVNYTWSFGDGSPTKSAAVTDTVRYTYMQPGVYPVQLTAQHQCGDTSLIKYVYVHQLPKAIFSLIPVSTCVGDSINFINSSTNSTSYLWQFGNGNTSTNSNPKQAYTGAGNYNVWLTAIQTYSTGVACRDSVSNPVVIVDNQPGNMTLSDSSGTCLPFSATFINRNQPSALTTWKFGDGNTATGDTVVHIYTTKGTFTATMLAKSAGGCNYTDTVKITIQPADGNLIYTAANYCGNNITRFTARLENTDSLIWHFGDGTVLHTTDTIVNHTYLLPGSYLPWAELIGKEGCRKIIKGADSIRVEKIKAGFAWSTTNECTVSTIQFIDTSRSFFGIDQWQWTFGDGTTATGKVVQHQYNTAGIYQVRLIVTSKLGCKDTITTSVNVVVYNKPMITIVNNNNACVFAAHQFTANVQSADSIISYVWDMGNGQMLQGRTVNATYTTAGTYTVKIIAGTINGCFDTATTTVTVQPLPQLVAQKELQICKGQQVVLQSTNATNVTWSNAQQVICTNCTQTTVSPTTTTKYYVTGASQYGCTTTDTVVVNVIQPFDIKTSLGDTICVGDQMQIFASGAITCSWSPSEGLSRTDIANPIAKPSSTTTYTVIGHDAFNCFSDTGQVHIVVGPPTQVYLGADTTVMAGSSMVLTSRLTNGNAAKYAWSSPSQLSCVNCPQPVATVKNDECFTCTVTNSFGCVTSDTICIKTFCKSAQVFIPNAFSPDGDGVNDVFYVMGTGVKIVKSFMIFNRWGELLFQKENFVPNNPSFGWDGTIRGQKAPPDVFVYICNVLCENDIPYSYKGNVAIIK